MSALGTSKNRDIHVTVDGVTHTYYLRNLLDVSDDALREWSEFCALVFSYKPHPPHPSYFARHYRNDPRRDPSLVQVLVHRPDVRDPAGEEPRGEIVASVRVFRRSLSAGGRTQAGKIEAGGVGEVCTHPRHQRRGLSKLLLKEALAVMPAYRPEGDGAEAGATMACSLLHAAPAFRPVYSKVGGYRSVRSEWSVVPVRLRHLSDARRGGGDGEGAWRVRHAEFPEDAVPLQRLYENYSERRLVTVVRSVEYWRDYISAEVEDKKMWVLTKQQRCDQGVDARDSIVGWICIRRRGDTKYQICDFGTSQNDNGNAVSSFWVMEHLLGVALQNAGEQTGSNSEVSLLLPTFVLLEMTQEMTAKNDDQEKATIFLDVANKMEEHDDGWMYVHFDESQPSILDLTERATHPVPHLIWPIDSF